MKLATKLAAAVALIMVSIFSFRAYETAHREDPAQLLPMHEVERKYFFHVLDSVKGNKTLAARILGFDRRTMYRKLESFNRPPEPAASAPTG